MSNKVSSGFEILHELIKLGGFQRSSPIFCVKFPLARIRCFYHHRLAYCTALGPWGQGRAKPGDNVSLTPGPPAVIKSYRW